MAPVTTEPAPASDLTQLRAGLGRLTDKQLNQLSLDTGIRLPRLKLWQNGTEAPDSDFTVQVRSILHWISVTTRR